MYLFECIVFNAGLFAVKRRILCLAVNKIVLRIGLCISIITISSFKARRYVMNKIIIETILSEARQK